MSCETFCYKLIEISKKTQYNKIRRIDGLHVNKEVSL